MRVDFIGNSAQDILDKRFANGEIDLQEYGEKSHILKKHC